MGIKTSAARLYTAAPTADAFTPYDEAHFALYLTLLHASADGWTEERMCRSVLKIDPESPRATKILRSHLARARWLSAEGRRHLLDV